jgi:hypothetical protein
MKDNIPIEKELPSSVEGRLALLQYQNIPITKKGKGYENGKPYTYSTLPNIKEALIPKLKELDLAYRFGMNPGENDKFTISLTIFCVDNISNKIILQANLKPVTLHNINPMQSFGAQITYIRRYLLTTGFDLITEDDNDSQGVEAKKRILTMNSTEWDTIAVELSKGLASEEKIKAVFTISDDDFEKLKEKADSYQY